MDRPPGPDWRGINRMVHYRIGMLRFENNLGPIKRKRLQEIFDEEVPTPKKMKFTDVPVIPHDNTLHESWDEALLERLQPANKSTNQKPGSATDDLLISLPQHHQSTTTGSSVAFPIHQGQRSKSAEPTIEACVRQARRQYLDEAVHLPVEHDDSEMPRTSPRSKKRAHSSSQDDVVDLSNDTELPLPKEEEGEASASDLETEIPVVISAKRIKPNSGEKLQEQSGTPEPESPTKTVSTGNAGSLRSGRQIHKGKEENASVEGNERDQKESSESKVGPKRPWSYFDTYNTRKPSNIRDFGNPRPVAPASTSSASRGQESMAPVPGGPKPINRLRPNTPHQQLHKFGNNASKPNAPFKPQVPKFDLHKDHNRRGEQPPSKRQRIEDKTTSRNGSLGSPIDLEASPATNGKATGTQTTGSFHSQVPKRSEYEVEEFGSLERMVKPGYQKPQKRQSSSSDGQASYGNRSRRFQPERKNERWVGKLDDETDPISEDDVAVTGSRSISKGASQSTGTPTVEIQIPSTRQAGRYQGSSFRRPPRQNLNGDRSRNQSTANARTQEISPHFPPPAQTRQQGQTPSGSHSADGTVPSRTSTRSSGLQNGDSSIKNASSRHLSPQPGPDESLDELNSDALHQQTAVALVARQKSGGAASSKPKGTVSRSQSIPLDVSSDDDLANDKANIQPTHFSSKRDTKGKIASEDEKYDAILVFSERDAWLADSSCLDSWSLVHNPISKTLELFDRGPSSVWVLPTYKVERIEYDSESQILVIHKARDDTTGRGTHIYLQLRNSDQSNDLRESLKTTQPTIQPIKKSQSYLKQVVDNNLAKVLSYQETCPAAKKRCRPEEPDDIKLAKFNSARRLESKWPSLKETTTSAARVEGKDTEDEETELPRSRSLARSMRTRSSSGHLEDEGLQQPFQVPEEVSSAEFYGNSTSRGANLGLSHETRSSTRVQDRDRAPRRQLRPREPSPPPLTLWTRKNPNWTKDWHNSIIYPAIGKDRARVDMGDIEKLDDGEFLNDNLIAFYLRWLQDQLERQHPELAKRIYFQNTFFYQKLSKPEKGIKGINYEAIKKWTSKVDLLSKDYIIIPINEHSHWYVAIICNAPKLLPGAVTTEHSQSQDTGGPPGDEHTNTEDAPKAAPLVPSKQFPESANGRDVDLLMKDVSLEDKKPEGSEALSPVSNGILEGQEAIESEDPPPANVISDLLELETVKESQTKKTKRKSMPPQRKYNPKEFRIITLDSLGSSHTTTCSNLKDYLVLEIKDKKNIDIERPGSIGTTAKGIPTQNNYYDCGLFLLSYVEMFLKSPDEFVSGILQNDSKEYQMPKALEMRTHIRKLLFRLQKEQFAEAERLAKLKGKGKKSSKTEDKCGSALTSKSPSREASKSVRVSPDGRTLDESRDAQEKAIQPKAEPSRKENPPISQTSASIEPPISFAPGKSDSPIWPASQVKVEILKPDEPKLRENHDLNAATNNSAKASGSKLNELFSGATKLLSGFLGHDKSATMNASDPKSSKADVIEIDESPQKVDYGNNLPRSRNSDMEDFSRTSVKNSPGVLQTGRSSTERANKERPTGTRHQRENQTSPYSPPRRNGRVFASPTPDAMEPAHRIPARNEVHDLRSPTPEVVDSVRNGSTKAQQRRSTVVEKVNRGVSEHRERAVKAPSPEIRETPSPRVSDRRPSRYPANGVGTSRQVVDVERGDFGAEGRDSDGEDQEDDPIDLLKTNSRANGVSEAMSETSANDDEMLLRSGSSREEEAEDDEAEDADPALFSSSPVRPRSVTPSKTYRKGGRSAPSSPASKHEGIGRASTSSEYRGTKRKSPGTGESDNWQEIRRPNPTLRDAADQAIIGRYRQHGHRRATHTKFNE